MPRTYKTGEWVNVPCTRQEANFDRACDQAMDFARLRFGVDECGHFAHVLDAPRSECCIEVEFLSYRAWGRNDHFYNFRACVRKNEEV